MNNTLNNNFGFPEKWKTDSMVAPKKVKKSRVGKALVVIKCIYCGKTHEIEIGSPEIDMLNHSLSSCDLCQGPLKLMIQLPQKSS